MNGLEHYNYGPPSYADFDPAETEAKFRQFDGRVIIVGGHYHYLWVKNELYDPYEIEDMKHVLTRYGLCHPHNLYRPEMARTLSAAINAPFYANRIYCLPRIHLDTVPSDLEGTRPRDERRHLVKAWALTVLDRQLKEEGTIDGNS